MPTTKCEIVFPKIWNWFCPSCKRWVAAADIDGSRRHLVKGCKTKVEWRSCEIVSKRDEQRNDET